MSTQPPVISRSELSQPATLDQLDLACREWGVFYLADHGLDQAETVFDQARIFFSRSHDQKSEVRRTAEVPWGYFDQELTKNTRDWKEVFDFSAQWTEQLPAWVSSLRHACDAHYRSCECLSFELLSAISNNLGVGGDFLWHAFEPDHASFLRLNYYPACPEPAAPEGVATPRRGHLGVNHHTDAGALTLLMSDGTPGLEVFVHDAWHPVPPVEGALIVNLGDVLQVWSNDRYQAALHRVRCHTDQERLSVPFFFNPRESFDYAPLAATTSAATPPRYRPINFGEFRSLRAAGDYADNGQEVQIEQFRTDAMEV